MVDGETDASSEAESADVRVPDENDVAYSGVYEYGDVCRGRNPSGPSKFAGVTWEWPREYEKPDVWW